MHYQHRVPASASGTRLETFLIKDAGLTPRSALKRAFSQKLILVNGRPADRSVQLRTDDLIEILDAAASLFTRDELSVKAFDAATLEIVSETADFVVAAKPSGVAAHPLRPSETSTLLNALANRYPDAAQALRPDRPLEGGLIHRIDRGTSGLIVCARNARAFALLREAWRSRNLEKVYLAWVVGYLQEGGRIETFLEHDPKSRKRMITAREPGPGRWAAHTSFIPLKTVTLETHEPVTLVALRIHTGVMHQIRATFAALGHPVLCDPIYLQKFSTPASRPGLSLMPLDVETSRILDDVALRLGPMIEPDPGAVPEQGFFLHALWLRVPGVAGLEQGLFAPPPPYFSVPIRR